MKCQICGNEFEEKKIQRHHLHPRFMDNKNGNGKKIYLCEKCHNILHLTIPAVLWTFIRKEDKNNAINVIKLFTEVKIK
jgi:5-methylcytosine-specific restriction endonuclease McrA